MTNSFSNYATEVDSAEKTSWESLLLEFEDANIYQTWSWGGINWGDSNLSNLILRKDREVVAMAQIRIRKLPIIKAGIATVFWGPLWRRKGRPPDYAGSGSKNHPPSYAPTRYAGPAHKGDRCRAPGLGFGRPWRRFLQ